MNPKETFIQKVICAPEPIAVLCTENNLNDIEKFCSNEIRFGVFQVDPTFDLGPFSVIATAYEHLLLINKDRKKHQVMMGPLLIHEKKKKILTKF